NLQEEGDDGSGFLWVKRRVTHEEAERLRSMKLDWIEFRTESQRFYPHGQLAAHVIGAMGMTHDQKDKDERGVAGVEEVYEADLRGKDGRMRVFKDVKDHAYETEEIEKPTPGADVVLTIDSRIQFVAERELEKAVLQSHSDSGSVIVARPGTGEILAMANYPTYEPGKPSVRREDLAARRDLAVVAPFEPGSVFKVITMAAALETTNLTPETVLNCGNGKINLFGRIIHDHDSYASLTMADVLAKSSNIGTIQAALRVGEPNLREYIERFGFGHRTGVGLSGESAGKVRKTWIKSSIGSVAIGHEISTTSVQLMQACSVVANGGLLVKPQLVLGRQRRGGEFERAPRETPKRILKPETAFKLRQMMEGVVLRGTGRHTAVLRGYSSAGKTGSAQIYDFASKQYTHHYNASFMGFAPVTNPAIVVVVTVHHTPSGSGGFGGVVAGPVFREVAQETLRILDVPKDVPERIPATELASAKQSDENDLSSSELSQGPELDAADSGNQAVSSVTLPPVLAVSGTPGTGQDRRTFSSARVPNFQGMTLRAVLEQSVAAGTPVEVVGSGLARAQMPSPGSVLAPGERVRVQFVR
ncbi:MAG: penicillin-binding protein, partial [Bryobacteraceae bacterium]